MEDLESYIFGGVGGRVGSIVFSLALLYNITLAEVNRGSVMQLRRVAIRLLRVATRNTGSGSSPIIMEVPIDNGIPIIEKINQGATNLQVIAHQRPITNALLEFKDEMLRLFSKTLV